MNREEVTQLLAAAATVDPYAPQPGELVLRVWTGMLEQVPMHAAESALWAHYRHSTETIKPADIVERWREQRRLEPEQRARPSFDPDRIHAGVDRVMAALAERKAIDRGADPSDASDVGQGEAGARRLVLSVSCPVCSAREGERCVVPATGRQLRQRLAHPGREQEASGRAGVSS